MASTPSANCPVTAATSSGSDSGLDVMTLNPIALPIISIQPDFQTVIADVRDGTVPQEDVWLSCYRAGATSVHGKVRIMLAPGAGAGGRREVELRGRNDVVIENAQGGHYISSCQPLGIPSTSLHVPRRAIQPPEDHSKTKQITALAVAPDLTQIAIGYADGTICRLPLIGSTLTSTAINGHAFEDTGSSPTPAPLPLTYSPHLSGTSVTALKYFPSSRVLLSGGLDFALHILDSELLPSGISDGNSTSGTYSGPPPVRTLRGHIRAITTAAIVSHGRNVLSAAKDATVRLWDVASAAQIRMVVADAHVPINALTLGETSVPSQEWAGRLAEDQAQGPSAAPDPREVGTANKLVFLALQDGRFEVLDVGARFARVYLSPRPSFAPSSSWGAESSADFASTRALTAIAYSPESCALATGSARGVVAVYDVRALRSSRGEAGVEPLCTFARNKAGIESLAFVPRWSSLAVGGASTTASSTTAEVTEMAAVHADAFLAIATSDGLPYVASIRPQGSNVYAELAAGADCEAVRAIEVDSKGAVWTASDDGTVRMY